MDALRPIVDWICSLELGHPVRVGLDGPSDAGKTTLADLLAETVQTTLQRPVVRASIGDFHRPGHKFRSMRGEWTTQSYYDESCDYVAFRDLLLGPLGPGGNRQVRTAIFDSFQDEPVPERWQTASESTILIVAGAFLQWEELRSDWDYVIWLKVDAETMISRARQHDVAWVGSADVVEQRYRTRMLPVHALYKSLVDPDPHADAVIDTTALSDRWRVIALDQRGRGGSARPGCYSFELMRDDLALFIDDLGLVRPVVVGHSMGGTVAYLYVKAFARKAGDC